MPKVYTIGIRQVPKIRCDRVLNIGITVDRRAPERRPFQLKTVTRTLQKVLKHVVIIYQDDFYKPDDQIPVDPTTQLANWDCPEALDFDRLRQTIQYTRQNHGRLPPEYSSTEVRNTHDGSSSVSDATLQGLRAMFHARHDDIFVLVDGFILYHDPSVAAEFDSKLFFIASYATLKQRRESRKGYTTADGYWVDPPEYFDKIVWPECVRWNKRFLDNTQTDHDALVIDTDKHTIVQAVEATAQKVLDSLAEP
ncbi:ribosylnicotinamide kinase [Apophysomyces sp. BC1034]|nr:ribosylnicotinamide kinase [Apophysomyces sp. BC1015]KAG0180521.1 ribosylnicotinamide kinase [Apophysomyces sp. BC1021]KAG0190997.1 ribosylnicotinamide kinase [Apophysomyces sp. BC1034]